MVADPKRFAIHGGPGQAMANHIGGTGTPRLASFDGRELGTRGVRLQGLKASQETRCQEPIPVENIEMFRQKVRRKVQQNS